MILTFKNSHQTCKRLKTKEKEKNKIIKYQNNIKSSQRRKKDTYVQSRQSNSDKNDS